MSNLTKLLDAVIRIVTDFRNLADDFQGVADAIAEFKTVEVTEPKPVAELTIKASKNEKSYTLEDVRRVLAEKSQSGHTAEVKKLIAKYVGSRLSDVQSDKYAEIIKEAEALGNE